SLGRIFIKQGKNVEMRRNDVGPLVHIPMQRGVGIHVKQGDSPTARAGIYELGLARIQQRPHPVPIATASVDECGGTFRTRSADNEKKHDVSYRVCPEMVGKSRASIQR